MISNDNPRNQKNDYPYLNKPKTSLERKFGKYKVTLQPYDCQRRGYWINTDAPNIWIVIHGLNNSPESDRIEHFANGLDEIIRSKQGEKIPLINTDNLNEVSRDDQVLVMDWSTAAKTNDLPWYPLIEWIPKIKDVPLDYASVASRVKDVGKALSEIVVEAGVDPKRVNIISHSLGSYVTAYAANFLDGVNTITLLDPAATYDPPLYRSPINILEEAPRFDEVSIYSIQFGSTSKLGTRDTLTHESYWVDFKGFDIPGEHGEILRWFIDNARRPIESGDASKFNFLASQPQYPIIGIDKNSDDVDGWEGTFWAIQRKDGWLTSAPEILPGKNER